MTTRLDHGIYRAHGLLLNLMLLVHRQLYQSLGATLSNTFLSLLQKHSAHNLQGDALRLPLTHPQRAPEASWHQRQDSLHPSAASLVLIVGGDLGEHLTEPPLQVLGVRPTRRCAIAHLRRVKGRRASVAAYPDGYAWKT